jgi:hypothetical protein
LYQLLADTTIAPAADVPLASVGDEAKKNFIRVHDKRGSYKTLFVPESITTVQLLRELAEKFNVSPTGTYGLFMKRIDTNQSMSCSKHHHHHHTAAQHNQLTSFVRSFVRSLDSYSIER